RRDPDDLVGVTVERDVAADGGRVAAELALPEAVAHDRAGGGAAGAIVGVVEDAAEHGLDAERGGEAAVDQETARPARLAALRQVEGAVAPDRDAGEGLLHRAQLPVDRVAEVGVPAREAALAPVLAVEVDGDELAGIAHRQRAQVDGLEELEDGGVGA